MHELTIIQELKESTISRINHPNQSDCYYYCSTTTLCHLLRRCCEQVISTRRLLKLYNIQFFNFFEVFVIQIVQVSSQKVFEYNISNVHDLQEFCNLTQIIINVSQLYIINSTPTSQKTQQYQRPTAMSINTAFKVKRLLLVLELNESLVYIKNQKSKLKDFNSDKYQLKFDCEVENHYGVIFRNGRPQFLDYLFAQDQQHIDVGIWSSLDSKLTQSISQKYFGRYLRDLLFILPTNRALYTKTNINIEPQDPLKIPKQLNGLYNKFPGYNSTNTLVLTCLPNTLPDHAKNDMIITPFTAKNQIFQQDVGCLALSKYIKGIVMRLKEQKLKDVRLINNGKPLQTLYQRLSHRAFSDNKYM